MARHPAAVDEVGPAGAHQLVQRRRLGHRVGQLAGVEVGHQACTVCSEHDLLVPMKPVGPRLIQPAT